MSAAEKRAGPWIAAELHHVADKLMDFVVEEASEGELRGKLREYAIVVRHRANDKVGEPLPQPSPPATWTKEQLDDPETWHGIGDGGESAEQEQNKAGQGYEAPPLSNEPSPVEPSPPAIDFTSDEFKPCVPSLAQKCETEKMSDFERDYPWGGVEAEPSPPSVAPLESVLKLTEKFIAERRAEGKGASCLEAVRDELLRVAPPSAAPLPRLVSATKDVLTAYRLGITWTDITDPAFQDRLRGEMLSLGDAVSEYEKAERVAPQSASDAFVLVHSLLCRAEPGLVTNAGLVKELKQIEAVLESAPDLRDALQDWMRSKTAEVVGEYQKGWNAACVSLAGNLPNPIDQVLHDDKPSST